MKAPTTKSTVRRKPVQYRARHKNLGDLKEEDTKHGFEHRMKVERSQIHASEPIYCSVWGGDQPVDSIELNSLNYRFAATKLEDHVRRPRRRTPATLTSDSNSNVPPYSDIQLSRNPSQDPRYPLFISDTCQNTPHDLRDPASFYPIVSGGHPEPVPAGFNFHPSITHNQNAIFNPECDGYVVSAQPQVNQQINTRLWGSEANTRSKQLRQFYNLSATSHSLPTAEPGTELWPWAHQHNLNSSGEPDHNYQWDLDMPSADDYYVYGQGSSALPPMPYTTPDFSYPYYPSMMDYSIVQSNENSFPQNGYIYGP